PFAYHHSSTRRPTIGASDTFLTLVTVTTSPPTFLDWPGITERYAVPFTGGLIRAFSSSGEGGAAGATAGVTSFLTGGAAADLLDCAKAAIGRARQQRAAANVSAGRL